MLLLQEFDFQIHHRREVQHAVADYLSRLESGEPTESTYDDLANADLLSLVMVPNKRKDEWITEMTHFLSSALLPNHLTLDARKRLALRSRNFCLVSDTLNHKGWDGTSRLAIR